MVPGQARYSRTVPEAWDSPETLELFQNPRVPTPWGFIFFPISETQVPGTGSWYLGLCQSARSLGQSQAVGTFPKTRVLTPWGFIFLSNYFKKIKPFTCGLWVFATVPKTQSPNIFWGFIFSQSPNTTGFGTVPEARDVETVRKTQSSNTMGFIFQSQRPKSLGQSKDFG